MDLAATLPAASGESTSAGQGGEPIVLSETDRSRLQTFVHLGHESARARTRAQVLLKLAEGWTIAQRAGPSRRSAAPSLSAATPL